MFVGASKTVLTLSLFDVAGEFNAPKDFSWNFEGPDPESRVTFSLTICYEFLPIVCLFA